MVGIRQGMATRVNLNTGDERVMGRGAMNLRSPAKVDLICRPYTSCTHVKYSEVLPTYL